MAIALLVLASVLALGACGGDDESSGEGAARLATPSASDFPKGEGKSFAQLFGSLAEGPVLAPTTSAYTAGRTNRVAFATFDVERHQVRGAQVAVYLLSAEGAGARGPYVATPQSLDVDAQYRSRQTAADLDSNDTIYVADVPIPKRGKYAIAGIAKLDGKELRTSSFPLLAASAGGPPGPGDRAPKVDTPTGDDVAGDLQKIDTRQPPLAELHEVSAADVIGKEPVVLLFATPQLCSSRVCGPVNDIEYQISADPKNDKVRFIHQEIYNDNEVSAGLRPQVNEYRLRTEPWAFVIARDGTISDRIEGAFSAAELQAAVDKIR